MKFAFAGSLWLLLQSTTAQGHSLVLAWPEAQGVSRKISYHLEADASGLGTLSADYDDRSVSGYSFRLRIASGPVHVVPFKPQVVSLHDLRASARRRREPVWDLAQARTDPGHVFQIGGRVIFVTSRGQVIFLPVLGGTVTALNLQALHKDIILIAFKDGFGDVHSYLLHGHRVLRAWPASGFALLSRVTHWAWGGSIALEDLPDDFKTQVPLLERNRYIVMDGQWWVRTSAEDVVARPGLDDRERALETALVDFSAASADGRVHAMAKLAALFGPDLTPITSFDDRRVVGGPSRVAICQALVGK